MGAQASLENFLHDALLETIFTKDCLEIQSKFSYVPVFVYGAEKFGFSDHIQLGHMPRMGVGHTCQSGFEMYNANFTGPLVLRSLAPASGKIYGELYLVPPPILFQLDDYFENTAFQNRERVYIRYHTPEEKDQKNKEWHVSLCWMYLGIPDMWASKLNGKKYQRMEVIKPDDKVEKQYYVFKKSDDLNRKGKL